MFRFTIRDVLWLTVVVALSLSWRSDRERIRRLADEEANKMAMENRRLQRQAEEYRSNISQLMTKLREARSADQKSLTQKASPAEN